MLQKVSPLEGARGLSGFKVLATPGKVRVVRHSPLKQKFGGDKQAEKDEYENARISDLILLLDECGLTVLISRALSGMYS